MPDFSEARIGDKVFDDVFGDATVMEIDSDKTIAYPVYVKFDSGRTEAFKLDGRIHNLAIRPSLHWGEVRPNWIEPKPPKRMVKQKLARWFIVTHCRHGEYVVWTHEIEPPKLPNEVHRWHEVREFEVEEEYLASNKWGSGGTAGIVNIK